MAASHRILLIDDNQPGRQQLAASLMDAGHLVYQSSGGEQEVLALFNDKLPDITLCDLAICSRDGFSLLRSIRVESLSAPVIVTSSGSALEQVVEAFRYGANDYLISPFDDPCLLDEAIERCLQQRQLRRGNVDYRQQLEKTNRNLQQNLKVLEQDHQAGRHVQFKMLPETPKTFGDYHFSHRIVPSLYLSGDFIDYFTVGDHHVMFFIADVSGHGASSAFVTVLLKDLFARKRSDYIHRCDETILSPVRMLEEANRDLLNTGIDKHATLCLGLIDLRRDSLLYSVAGHLPLPILSQPSGTEFLRCEGMPIGLFEGAQYEQNELLLPENFVLTLFTDGILEVVSAEGLLEQEKFLLEALQQGQTTIKQVVVALGLERVTDVPDDIAALLISK